MHWIVTHSDHKNTNKVIPLLSNFLLVFASLGEIEYQSCLNTPNPSLTLIISQMHWIVTHFDHRKTNKAIY